MMPLDLEKDIFRPVFERIRDRADSLREFGRLQNVGIEGWLKVETVAALGDKVNKLNNKGPDLTLKDGRHLELKGETGFNPRHYKEVDKGGLKAPCLFLGDGGRPDKIYSIEDNDTAIVCYEVFSSGNKKWVLGIIRPKRTT